MTANRESGNSGAHPTEPGILAPVDAKTTWTVEGVVAKLPGGAPKVNSSSPVAFFHILERLKTTKREGWRRFGISHCESISDHMYRMSLITMLAPPSLSSKINIPHCTKMALVHDLAETLVGDITPMDEVTKHEKNRREETSMGYLSNSLLGNVNGGIMGKEINDIWREFEDGKTLESKFVQDVDKIELVLQMMEYERVHGHTLDLGDFSWVASRIVLPEVKEWADEVLREREEYWGGRPHTTFSAQDLPEEKSLAQKLEYYGKALDAQ